MELVARWQDEQTARGRGKLGSGIRPRYGRCQANRFHRLMFLGLQKMSRSQESRPSISMGGDNISGRRGSGQGAAHSHLPFIVSRSLGQRVDGELLLIAQSRADCPRGLPDTETRPGPMCSIMSNAATTRPGDTHHWLCQPYGIREDRRSGLKRWCP
jgi:hypothetical protein